jgi:hypothetical protein
MLKKISTKEIISYHKSTHTTFSIPLSDLFKHNEKESEDLYNLEIEIRKN